jgi:hypothetical protein
MPSQALSKNQRKTDEAKIVKTEASMIGKVVEVVYLDHALFLNSSPQAVVPLVKQAVGWLSSYNNEYITLVFNKNYQERPYSKIANFEKADGIVILKNCVLRVEEVRESVK